MLSAQVLTLLGFACYAVTLITLQREWGLTNFQSGLIASSFFFGYIGFVSLATVLTDRFDAKRIYLFGVTVEFLGLMGFSLVTSGFLSALFFMFLIGAGISGTYMPGLKILTDRLKSGEITRYIFLLHRILWFRRRSFLWYFGYLIGYPRLALCLWNNCDMSSSSRNFRLLLYYTIIGTEVARKFTLAMARYFSNKAMEISLAE
jgi:MFS family permease